ncbi:PKD domain-containing protein [Niabella insulamsoli]|uniref:PKD domain-containing protein n=1 Tax=Niabella insulamsoli TaxID=3144874 RepID=UPI0031FD7FFC
MKYVTTIYCLFVFYINAFAQHADSAIVATPDSSKAFSFSIKLPALTQIPGAPEPFYTYLWDFGDGHFSMSEKPEHIYAKADTYDVYLYAVNNYDDGKKPQRKKQKVNVSKNQAGAATASVAEENFFKANDMFELKYNSMAKPNDTMVLIAGWKNTDLQPTEGTLYLMLNEKQFEQTCFDTSGFRAYGNAAGLTALSGADKIPPLQSSLLITESGSPASNFPTVLSAAEGSAALSTTLALYKNVYASRLESAPTGEAKFSFLQLHVTPEMIKDTNATLTITGVYVPDRGKPVMHKLSVPVVNSHDPNKMNIKGGRIGYRFLKKYKPLDYKIRFQNNGKGPARKIALDITMAPVLDPQSIKVKDMHPFCPPCDSAAIEKRGCWELLKNDSGALFTFHGIYLKGTHQKGVEDLDSTKGFMEFEIVTKKKLEKKPFKSRTAIYFDKNEPVITNYATGRFKKSLSSIIMAGYEKAFGDNRISSDGLVTGFGVAPLAPYLPYWQAEFYYKAGITTQVVNTSFDRVGTIFIDSLKRNFEYNRFDSMQENNISQLKLIPIQLRHNINNFISVGVGAVVTADISGSIQTRKSYQLLSPNGVNLPYTVADKQTLKSFSNWKARPFFDLQIGKVKLGPHLGLRYYYNGKNKSFGYFYAGWRL